MRSRKLPEALRSHRWFGESDIRGFGHHFLEGTARTAEPQFH